MAIGIISSEFINAVGYIMTTNQIHFLCVENNKDNLTFIKSNH